MFATWAVKSKFVGEIAWFCDYNDALEFIASNPSIHEDHYSIVEMEQGEPSDAQVEAAHSAFWGHDDITGSHEQMRAVLRAAMSVRVVG